MTHILNVTKGMIQGLCCLVAGDKGDKGLKGFKGVKGFKGIKGFKGTALVAAAALQAGCVTYLLLHAFLSFMKKINYK